jgi:hypothetical protein
VSKRDPKKKKEVDGSKWWCPNKSLANLGNFWLIVGRCNRKYHSMHIVDQSNRSKWSTIALPFVPFFELLPSKNILPFTTLTIYP